MVRKRVFTKFLNTAVLGPPTVHTAFPDADFWVTQEDIDIIGIQLELCVTTSFGNDGTGGVDAEVSQVAVARQDGVMCLCTVEFDWNTVPAFGAGGYQTVTMMLPEDKIITVREEGRVSLNVDTYCANVTAGNTAVCVHAIVFYTKRG